MQNIKEKKFIDEHCTKKVLGAYYTPIYTAEYMISLFSDFNEKSKLLEPCGGDGVFVRKILDKKLLKPNQIEVIDINSKVKDEILNLGVNFQIKDTLIEVDSSLYSLLQKTYTHIISNPPYLNKQSQYIKQNKKNLQKRFKEIGVNDTYAMFLYLCGNLLADNGELVFIISDTYRTLGIHKKFRYWILKNFIIKQIILCPSSLFRETGTLVKTSIIHLIKKNPPKDNQIIFNDCQENALNNYNGKIYKVYQNAILEYPNHVFYFENDTELLKTLKSTDKKLVDFLEGGLGMHTTNNQHYLALIDYGKENIKFNKKNKNLISIKEINNNNKWKIYHKTGGNNQFYKKPSWAIKWDLESIKHYKIPNGIEKYFHKQGFLISGVCSKLSARIAFRGALWESNKAMFFTPKNPEKYPIFFFIGILNSEVYNKIIRIFNHTNSIQIRDIKKLPMFDFKDEDIDKIAKITKIIIEKLKQKFTFDIKKYKNEINLIVSNYI
jgi:phospholipid N-methyltransferase